MKVVGMFLTFQRCAMECPSSQPIGNVTPVSFAKSRIPVFSSSTEIPTISTLSPAFFERISSCGNDDLQGAHHVAQKSTTRIFPCFASSEIFPLPLSDCTESSGAGLPTSTGELPAG